MDFQHFMPVKVVSGAGCLSAQLSLVKPWGNRCLILTGQHAAKASGALDDLTTGLESMGIEYTVFSEIHENPRLSQCQAAAAVAQAHGADFVVGVGGGSVMDAAKAAAWLAANHPEDGEALMACRLPHPPLPLALVGTSAGTGSEVSAVSVLTMDDTGRKKSVTHPLCFARLAFADPRYTHSSPRGLTISSALDALCHATEGFLAPSCGDFPTLFGRQALPMVMEGLDWLASHPGLPDESLRETMYYGSLWAGMVLSAMGTAFPHPMGYVLTEEFGVPHGMACAVFLPALLERARQHCPQRMAELEALCGGRDRLDRVLAALVKTDVAMTPERVASYRPRWEGLKNFQRTPGGMTTDDAQALLTSLFVR